VHYRPIHRIALSALQEARRRLPITDDVAARLVTLPVFGRLREVQFDLVVDGALDAI
jgi:dTDP-4-amino-4,6-dideoxygalactose transaminase